MAIVTKTVLKSYFETGDIPTQAEFINLIDTLLSFNAAEISTITEKTTPAANDVFIVEDSAASNAKKKVKYSNLGGGGSSSKIEDTLGTTYLDSEEATYPGQLIGKNPQTGTDLMFQLFNGDGTPAPTHQVDAVGNIYDDGKFINVLKNTNGVFLGTHSTHAGLTSASNSVFAGYLSGASIISGGFNVGVGPETLFTLTTGANNTAVGRRAGYFGTSKTENSYFGAYSGFRHLGNASVFIGRYSGQWQTSASDLLLIGSKDHGNAANELTNTLITGEFDASPANQWVQFNGHMYNTQYKSGATQIAAGANAGEKWVTLGHATLPDNVQMQGV